jgi:hypothetical protein
MSKDRLPTGWDEARVQRVLRHYDEQTEDEAMAEDEAVQADTESTMMAIPTALVPAVRELIASSKR